MTDSTRKAPMNPPMPNPDMLLFHVAHDEVSQAVAQFCAGLHSAALGDFATARFAAQLADIGANRALALFALRGHIITMLGAADFEERRAALDMLALAWNCASAPCPMTEPEAAPAEEYVS